MVRAKPGGGGLGLRQRVHLGAYEAADHPLGPVEHRGADRPAAHRPAGADGPGGGPAGGAGGYPAAVLRVSGGSGPGHHVAGRGHFPDSRAAGLLGDLGHAAPPGPGVPGVAGGRGGGAGGGMGGVYPMDLRPAGPAAVRGPGDGPAGDPIGFFSPAPAHRVGPEVGEIEALYPGIFHGGGSGPGAVAAAQDLSVPADGPAVAGERQPLGNGEAAVLAVSSGGSGDLAAGPRGGLPGRALSAAGGDAPVHGGAVLAAAGPVAAAVEPGAGRGTDPPRHGAVPAGPRRGAGVVCAGHPGGDRLSPADGGRSGHRALCRPGGRGHGGHPFLKNFVIFLTYCCICRRNAARNLL